jgi:predicted permease
MRTIPLLRRIGAGLGCLSIVAMLVLGFASSLVPALRKGPVHTQLWGVIGLILGINSGVIGISALWRGYIDVSDAKLRMPEVRLSADDQPGGFLLYALFFLVFGVAAVGVGLYYLWR